MRSTTFLCSGNYFPYKDDGGEECEAECRNTAGEAFEGETFPIEAPVAKEEDDKCMEGTLSCPKEVVGDGEDGLVLPDVVDAWELVSQVVLETLLQVPHWSFLELDIFLMNYSVSEISTR